VRALPFEEGKTVIAASVFGYVVGTGGAVLLLICAVPIWRDKRPWVRTIDIGGRTIEERVDTTRWGQRLVAVAFVLFGCLVLLGLYGKRGAVVLAWIVGGAVLVAFGLLPVYLGVRIWRKPGWFRAARAPRHGEDADIDVDVDLSGEGLTKGAISWAIGRLLLSLPPRVSAVCLIALGLAVWAFEGLEISDKLG
jgi:hypothetical protein